MLHFNSKPLDTGHNSNLLLGFQPSLVFTFSGSDRFRSITGTTAAGDLYDGDPVGDHARRGRATPRQASVARRVSEVETDADRWHMPKLSKNDLGAEIFRLTDLLMQSEKKILEFGKENVQLREQIAQLKMVQELLRESLLDAENKIEDLRGGVVQERQAVAEWEARCSRLQNEAAEREALLQEILTSTSWRISAPIRIVGRQFPKLARASQKILRSQRAGEPTVRRGSQLGTDAPDNPRSLAVARTENSSVNSLASNVVSPVCGKLESVDHFSLLQSNGGKRLFLAAADVPPMFDHQSGASRLYMMMRILLEGGWRLSFASEATRDDFEVLAASTVNRERYESRLREIGVQNIAYGREEINAFLESEGSGIRWVLLSSPNVAHSLIPRIRIHAPWASIIYNMVDFNYLRMRHQAYLNSDGTIRSSALQMREIEIANARTSDLTLAISEDKRQALLELDPNLVVKVVPNIFDVPADSDPELASRQNLFFVGKFAHDSNTDAVQWFVEQIWPLIRPQRPNLKLIIAGSSAPEGALNLAPRPGVEVLGAIDDLTPLFRRARVFVAPLRIDAGTTGEVGQSMAQGLPVVGTKIAAAGMNAVNGKDLLVADEPAAFAAAVIRLLDDDALWLQLRANSKELIRQTQSVAAARIKLGCILNG